MSNDIGTKKGIAIILLVICNMAAVFAISIISLLVFLFTFILPLAILVGLTLAAATGFAASRIFRVLKRKKNFKLWQFIVSSFVSPVAGAAIYWIVFLILDAVGYFKGFLPGLGEAFVGISLSAAAAVYFIVGTAWCTAENDRSIEEKLL